MNKSEFCKRVDSPLTIGGLLDILHAVVESGGSHETLIVVEGCDCTDFARGARLGLGFDENDNIKKVQLAILCDGKQFEDGEFYISDQDLKGVRLGEGKDFRGV